MNDNEIKHIIGLLKCDGINSKKQVIDLLEKKLKSYKNESPCSNDYQEALAWLYNTSTLRVDCKDEYRYVLQKLIDKENKSDVAKELGKGGSKCKNYTK